jgi:lipopolysaccharide biosynthesis glycosyltransferase
MDNLNSSQCIIPTIVSTANTKYALPVAIMLKSLEQNLLDSERVIVHILYSEFDQLLQKEIELNLHRNKIELHWKYVDSKITDGLKTSYWWTPDVYYRLLIEELFPNNDKVIYLDADTIINRSLYDLWNMDMEDDYLLAIPHVTKEAGYVSGKYGLPVYKILGIPETTRTFNSGVLVMNLKLWRRDQIAKSIFQYLIDYKEHVLWLDQDALNAVLYDKWRPIDYEWNVQLEDFSAALTAKVDAFLTQRECMKIYDSPAIIHFAGGKKPWWRSYDGLFKNYFHLYLDQLSESFLESCSWFKLQNGDDEIESNHVYTNIFTSEKN